MLQLLTLKEHAVERFDNHYILKLESIKHARIITSSMEDVANVEKAKHLLVIVDHRLKNFIF